MTTLILTLTLTLALTLTHIADAQRMSWRRQDTVATMPLVPAGHDFDCFNSCSSCMRNRVDGLCCPHVVIKASITLTSVIQHGYGVDGQVRK